MNHKNTTLAIAAIVAAVALSAAAIAIPQQQALAWEHHNHNNKNSIKVDQQINQANFCDNGAQCLNNAENNFGPPPVVTVWK
jgi:uncharacterized protein HemX